MVLVVDIEASGVDTNKHSIVSIGAVDMNNPDYQFYEECKIWEGAKIMKEALEVNGFTIEEIKDESKQTPEQLIEAFLFWANQSDCKNLAGHNPQFDTAFMRNAALRAKIQWPFAYRLIDLHSICFAHLTRRGLDVPMKNGKSALNSDFVFKYVGLDVEPKPHHALTGAKMEAEALNRLLCGRGLLKEFEGFLIPEYL